MRYYGNYKKMNKSDILETQEKESEDYQIKKEFNRYENSKLYKMIDIINGYFYIRSTCTSLSKRLHQHKNAALQKPDRKVYKHMLNIG